MDIYNLCWCFRVTAPMSSSIVYGIATTKLDLWNIVGQQQDYTRRTLKKFKIITFMSSDLLRPATFETVPLIHFIVLWSEEFCFKCDSRSTNKMVPNWTSHFGQ